jgi:hypothetical protein
MRGWSRLVNCQEFERMWLWSVSSYLGIRFKVVRNTMKIPVRVISIPAEIRSWHLSSSSRKLYRLNKFAQWDMVWEWIYAWDSWETTGREGPCICLSLDAFPPTPTAAHVRVTLLPAVTRFVPHLSNAYNRNISLLSIPCYLLLEACNYEPRWNCRHNSNQIQWNYYKRRMTDKTLTSVSYHKVCRPRSWSYDVQVKNMLCN